MKTDFDIARSYQLAPAAVFNPDFNNSAPISATQAWSLFFTAGRDDAALGNNPELGRLLNNTLITIAVAVALGSLVFTF